MLEALAQYVGGTLVIVIVIAAIVVEMIGMENVGRAVRSFAVAASVVSNSRNAGLYDERAEVAEHGQRIGLGLFGQARVHLVNATNRHSTR